MISASRDNTIKIQRIHKHEKKVNLLMKTLCGHISSIFGLIIHSNGQFCVSGSCDIKIWSTKTGKNIRTLFGHFH